MSVDEAARKRAVPLHRRLAELAAIMTIPVAVLFFAFQRRIMSTGEGAVKG